MSNTICVLACAVVAVIGTIVRPMARNAKKVESRLQIYELSGILILIFIWLVLSLEVGSLEWPSVVLFLLLEGFAVWKYWNNPIPFETIRLAITTFCLSAAVTVFLVEDSRKKFEKKLSTFESKLEKPKG